MSIIEDLIRNISGRIGILLRRAYYRNHLGACGAGVNIAEGVYFITPKKIFLHENVCIDKYAILIAGKQSDQHNTKPYLNLNFDKEEGTIHIGSNSHIGINSVLQGHGGISTGDYFTTSPHCKIYSLSNDYSKCKNGTYGDGEKYYLKSPVVIGTNVWLGLNVCILGGTIGNDTFIMPNAIVYEPIEANSVASGSPAKKIKNRFD